MKFIVENLDTKEGLKDIEFEIQKVDSVIYYDTKDLFNRGVLKFSEFATVMLRDSIVSPSEASKVKYFKNDMEALDLVCGAIMGLQEKKTKRASIKKLD